MRATNAIYRLREQLGDAPAAEPIAPSYPQGYVPPLPGTPRDRITENFARVLPSFPPGTSLDFHGSTQPPPRQVAPASETVSGPLLKGDALPVWNTRLSGMRDQTHTLTFEADASEGPIETSAYVVPAGYLAIIRRYRFAIEPPAAAVNMATATLTFMLDGVPVPFMSGIPVESFMPAYSDVFIQAESFQRLTVVLSLDDPDETILITGRIMCLLYIELRPPVPYAPALTCCAEPTPAPLPVPEPQSQPVNTMPAERARNVAPPPRSPPPPVQQTVRRAPPRSPPPPPAPYKMPTYRRSKR